MKPLPRLRRARGAAAIEFALVFISVLTVVIICWIAGNMALQRSLIKDAARNAAMLVADATPAELASSAAISDLEERAEATLTEAIERAGSAVQSVQIRRRNAVTGYNPALRTVEVDVEAIYSEQVFPDTLPFGEFAIGLTVEVPHGSRLAGP